MKKIVSGFVLILGIMAVLSSCGTTYKMVVDENVPADRNATVTFSGNGKVAGGFLVKEHNNRNILDDLYGGGRGNWNSKVSTNGVPDWTKDKTILTVPAGNNRFLFDARIEFGDSIIADRNIFQEITNLEIRYDLEPGKKYLITGTTKRTKLSLLDIGKGDLYVGIYDVTTGRQTLLREWKVGEYN